MNQLIDINRIILLIKRIFFLNKKPIIYGSLAFIGILTLINSLANIDEYSIDKDTMKGTFFAFYMFIGIIVTSMLFKEQNDKNKNQIFLSLPVSTIEKTFAYWFSSTVIYSIVNFILLNIVFLLVIGISSLYGVKVHSYFINFNDLTTVVCCYFFYNAVFFLGASTFKNNTLIKTLISSCLLIFLVGIYSLLNIWLIYDFEFNTNLNINPDEFSPALVNTITFILYIILISASYYKLKEKEA